QRERIRKRFDPAVAQTHTLVLSVCWQKSLLNASGHIESSIQKLKATSHLLPESMLNTRLPIAEEVHLITHVEVSTTTTTDIPNLRDAAVVLIEAVAPAATHHAIKRTLRRQQFNCAYGEGIHPLLLNSLHQRSIQNRRQAKAVPGSTREHHWSCFLRTRVELGCGANARREGRGGLRDDRGVDRGRARRCRRIRLRVDGASVRFPG